MAWIESHQALEKHPKLLDLVQRMGWSIDEAIGKLHRFWWWCTDFAPNGDLRRYSAVILAGTVGLSSDRAEDFVNNMVDAGWLDKKPYLRVHDWWDHSGRFLQVRYKHNPAKWQEVRQAYPNRSYNGSKSPTKHRSKNLYQPTKINQPTNRPTPLVRSGDDWERRSETMPEGVREMVERIGRGKEIS